MSLKIFINSLKKGEILLPVLRKHLVESARLEASGKKSHQADVIRDAEMTIKCFSARKDEYNHRTKLKGDFFHPSQIGGCLRSMMYDELHAPSDGVQSGEDRLKSHLIFEVGTYFHVLFQNLCERAGVLLKREIAIQDKVNRILGHADGAVRIAGITYLLEIKTISGRSFPTLTEVKAAHKQQIHAYMKSLGYKAAIVVYYSKDTSELKEYCVPYSESYFQKQVALRLDMFFSYKRKKKLPPKEGESPYTMPCSYCSFRRLCFDDRATKRWLKTI